MLRFCCHSLAHPLKIDDLVTKSKKKTRRWEYVTLRIFWGNLLSTRGASKISIWNEQGKKNAKTEIVRQNKWRGDATLGQRGMMWASSIQYKKKNSVVRRNTYYKKKKVSTIKKQTTQNRTQQETSTHSKGMPNFCQTFLPLKEWMFSFNQIQKSTIVLRAEGDLDEKPFEQKKKKKSIANKFA